MEGIERGFGFNDQVGRTVARGTGGVHVDDLGSLEYALVADFRGCCTLVTFSVLFDQWSEHLWECMPRVNKREERAKSLSVGLLGGSISGPSDCSRLVATSL